MTYQAAFRQSRVSIVRRFLKKIIRVNITRIRAQGGEWPWARKGSLRWPSRANKIGISKRVHQGPIMQVFDGIWIIWLQLD